MNRDYSDDTLKTERAIDVSQKEIGMAKILTSFLGSDTIGRSGAHLIWQWPAMGGDGMAGRVARTTWVYPPMQDTTVKHWADGKGVLLHERN